MLYIFSILIRFIPNLIPYGLLIFITACANHVLVFKKKKKKTLTKRL